MSTEPPYPGVSTNGSVPWHVYLADREQQNKRFDRFESKLDKMADSIEGIKIAAAHDDGADVAKDAATAAVEKGKKTRGERLWDLFQTTIAAVLGVIGTLIAVYLTGGPS